MQIQGTPVKRLLLCIQVLFWAIILSYVLPNVIGFISGIFFPSTAGDFESIKIWTKPLNFGFRTIAYTVFWLALSDPRVRSFHPHLRFVAILLSFVKFGFDFGEVFFRNEALSFTAYLLKVILGAGSIFVAAVYFAKICLAFKFGRLANAWMRFAWLYFIISVFLGLSEEVFKPVLDGSGTQVFYIVAISETIILILGTWGLKLLRDLGRNLRVAEVAKLT
jgi:hypothetical protein